jgi:hypothetical protein
MHARTCARARAHARTHAHAHKSVVTQRSAASCRRVGSFQIEMRPLLHHGCKGNATPVATMQVDSIFSCIVDTRAALASFASMMQEPPVCHWCTSRISIIEHYHMDISVGFIVHDPTVWAIRGQHKRRHTQTHTYTDSDTDSDTDTEMVSPGTTRNLSAQPSTMSLRTSKHTAHS